MKLVVLYVLAMPLAMLGFAAASMFVGSVKHTTIFNPGPHGLTEILYAFTSAANNNGSAFAGITANTQWMDTTLGIAMLIGRFFLIIPVLGIAGSLAQQAAVPGDRGHVPDAHAAVRRPRDRRDDHRRGPHVLPGLGARPHRRAPVAVGAGPMTQTETDPRPVGSSARERHPLPTKSLFDPTIVRGAVVDSFKKLEPARPGPQPGHVRRARRQRADDDPVLPRPRLVHDERERVRRPRRRCSCGSPCCSPTSPRRWPKAAARRRPRRCARRVPRRWPGAADPTAPSRRSRAASCRSATCASSPRARSFPSDGDVVEGIATVDESAITGESAPVIRESGGDRSAVTGGTRVLSDEIVVRITARAG